MKNFPIKHEGKTFWISRAVAVAGFVYFIDIYNDRTFILACKRGPGCPDFVGLWNCPCGYLDYNETCQQAVVREIFEETGFELKPEQMKLIYINDDPEDSNKQNITFRYGTCINGDILPILNTDNSEEDEVEELKWIDLDDLDEYEFAFGHKELIKEYFWQA